MGEKLGAMVVAVAVAVLVAAAAAAEGGPRHRNAYATMIYMGTPRDYEFYVATRVMLRSLARLAADADLVVIASVDVPRRWLHALEQEDGARVVRVENLNNPYKKQANFDKRFELTMNKLYVWSLVDYDRVVMLDSDNLFLQNTDELFQCGQFCAVFINPCIFHTGLFVLQPSMEVFKGMLRDLEIGRENPDGADQGFIGSYFPLLLDQPMFHPPANGSRFQGTYRLPLGYQMDASYYYLKLRWSIPCGPNSVITYPGAPWMKPWYWWSWPALPLGLQWHEQRRQTLGYSAEMPIVLIQSVFYLGIMAMAGLARPGLFKLCYRRADKSMSLIQAAGLKLVAMWSILAAYTIPAAALHLLKDLENRGIANSKRRKQESDTVGDLSSQDLGKNICSGTDVDPSEPIAQKRKLTASQLHLDPYRSPSHSENSSTKSCDSKINTPVLASIDMKKGGPRTSLYSLCKKLQWPMPTFETTENKSRTLIEFCEGSEKRTGFNSFVSTITLTIPEFGDIEQTGDHRADKKSSFDSAALVMLFELERQGRISIEGVKV